MNSQTHHARFELRQDEETGRLYWWGGEDGWKDATEVGENGALTLDAQHFTVGSVLTLVEPFDPTDFISAEACRMNNI